MSWCFCKIEKENYVLENELAFAIWDIKPASTGHMLIIPKMHSETFFDVCKEEREACFELLEKAKELIDEKYKPDGYNIVVNAGEAAGQTVFHLHIHLIPRYKGQTVSVLA